MGQLYEISPFTLLDYPGEIACIAWFAGCNMRCVFCHNPAIVEGKGDKTEDELLSFLKTRHGRLSGVVFSGGEATLYPGLLDLMKKVKALGFKVKLDTNGSRPEIVRALLDAGVLDYVALDYKCLPARATEITGNAKWVEPFRESLKLFIAAAAKGLAFEVRTTFHADLMREDEIAQIMEDLAEQGYAGTYYLQNVVSYGEKTIGEVAQPLRELDKTLLPDPRGFRLALRNFKEPPQREG